MVKKNFKKKSKREKKEYTNGDIDNPSVITTHHPPPPPRNSVRENHHHLGIMLHRNWLGYYALNHFITDREGELEN